MRETINNECISSCLQKKGTETWDSIQGWGMGSREDLFLMGKAVIMFWGIMQSRWGNGHAKGVRIAKVTS